MREPRTLLVLAALLLAPSSALATSATLDVFVTRPHEAPGPGDPDGSAAERISLDDATGQVSCVFTHANMQIPRSPGDVSVNIHTGPLGAEAVRGQVPEPATALLFGAGLAGLAFGGRRIRTGPS